MLGLLEAKLKMRVHVQVIYDLFSKCSQEQPAREWRKPDRERWETGKDAISGCLRQPSHVENSGVQIIPHGLPLITVQELGFHIPAIVSH